MYARRSLSSRVDEGELLGELVAGCSLRDGERRNGETGRKVSCVSEIDPFQAAGAPGPAGPQAGWYSAHDGPYERWWDGRAWTAATRPSPIRQAVLPPVVYTDRRDKSGEAVVAWVVTVLTLGYMLPWAVAATRGKSNSGAIAVLNLFVGWTVIGWIASLVMACSAHQTAAVGQVQRY